jgi:titin
MWELLYDGTRQGFYFYPYRGSTSVEIFTGLKTVSPGTWTEIEVQYNATAGGGAQLSINGQTNASWGVSGDFSRTNHYRILQLWNDGGNAVDFDDVTVASATAPATVPAAPSNLTGTAGDRSVALSWSAPSSDGGSAITGYRITPYVGSTPQTPVSTQSTATTATVSGLTNGTAYTFTVAAMNVAGTGAESGATPSLVPRARATAPDAPTSVAGSAGDRSVALSWTAPASDGGSPVTGYRVTPYLGSTAQTPVDTGSAATEFTVTGLTNGSTYTFTVAAVNAVGTGNPSAPSGQLTPDASATAYPVFSDGFEGGSLAAWNGTSGTGLVSVTAAAAYKGSFGVRLDNALAQYSVVSKRLPAAVVDSSTRFAFRSSLSAGTQVIAQARDEASSGRMWELHYDAGRQGLYFYPYRGTSSVEVFTGAKTVPVSTWSEVAVRYTATSSGVRGGAQLYINGRTKPSWSVTGDFSRSNHYRILQLWNDGGKAVDFDDVAVTSAERVATTPGAPSGLAGTAGDRSVTLNWTSPSSDGGSSITGYRITPYVGTSAQSPILTQSTATTATVSGLTNGTAYTFTVAAVNAAGTGSESTASPALTPRPNASVPGAPSNLTGWAGSAAVTLSWTAPASDGGSPIKGYRVTPYIGTVAQQAVLTGSTSTTTTISGLVNDTRYTFTVAAVNDAGTGGESNRSVELVPRAEPTEPSAPTRLTGTPGDRSVALSWSPPSDDGGRPISGYRITPYIGTVAQPRISTGSTATKFTVTQLANGTAYRFTVAAINAVGTSPDSAATGEITPKAATAPGVPTAVSGKPGDGSVRLSWSAPADDGGSAIVGYRITPYVEGAARTPVDTGSTATGHTVGDLVNGTAYTFTVAAINGVGTGAASDPSAPVTPAAVIAPTAMPLISRGVPAFTNDACAGSYPASNANDANYRSYWRACNSAATTTTPKWLAYDLSAVAPERRSTVVVTWFNEPMTGQYDHAFGGGVAYNNVGSYSIEVSAAAGGTSAPTSGWSVKQSVTGNTYNSRQAVIDMSGHNWLRINVTAPDGSPGNSDIALNFDVHDASGGVTDDWIFYGDSITQDGMYHDTRTAASGETVGTFSELVNAIKPGYSPLFQNGGIGGLTSVHAASRFSTWIALFPGRYVTLNYGTNDALAGAGDPTIAGKFRTSMQSMIDAVVAAGKIPIVPTIPWGRDAKLQANVPVLNAQIDQLYTANPQVVRGPDLYAYFNQRQDLISADGIHPTWQSGYAGLRQQWAAFAAAMRP